MTEFEDAEFWEYATFDEKGFLNGLREDAPERVRAEYEAFMEEQQYAKEHNMKI